jgi:hypothetical protein
MTYSSGSVIQDRDYNNFVWGDNTGSGTMNINNNLYYLYGPGRADRGINQSLNDILPGLPGGTFGSTGTLTKVTSPQTITATQWIGFFSALNRLRYYQEGTGGNVTLSVPPAVGSTISVQALLNTKLTSANAWYSSPTPSNGIAVTSASDTKAVNVNYSNYAGTIVRTYKRTITWDTGDHARWFFNSGGRVRLSITGETVGTSDRSSAMVSTLQQMGECFVSGYNLSIFTGNDAASNPGAGLGYWGLGTTNKQIGSNTLGAGTYSDSFCTAFARVIDTAGNGSDNGAVGKTLEITVTVSSGFGGTGTLTAWATDTLNINLSMSIDIIDQTGSGSVISRTWNNPTMSSWAFVSGSP